MFYVRIVLQLIIFMNLHEVIVIVSIFWINKCNQLHGFQFERMDLPTFQNLATRVSDAKKMFYIGTVLLSILEFPTKKIISRI